MALPKDWQAAADHVVALHAAIKDTREDIFNEMEAVERAYYGDMAIPLPQIEKSEAPAIANLIYAGIEQNAMRTASVLPNVGSELYGYDGSEAAVKRQTARRRAVQGWWKMNDWQLKNRRRCRHLTAYGMMVVTLAPVSTDPSDKRMMPFWRVRNPLHTFPAPMMDVDSRVPSYCIFTDKKPMAWFQDRYPNRVGQLFGANAMESGSYDLLEYIDDTETVLVGVGAERMEYDFMGRARPMGMRPAVCLDRVENRCGITPVVIGGRMGLHRMQSQYFQALGPYRREATLDSLNTIAIMRNVFPEQWVQSAANSPSSPRIIRRANAKKGEIGVVDKGVLATVRPPMDPAIMQAMDRYEGSIRATSGVPAGYSGLSPSNVRTGRQYDSVTSDAVDMWLQENQEILAACAEDELHIAITMEKKYFGSRSFSFRMGKDGVSPSNDFVPNRVFETDLMQVRFPLPGTDINQLTVQLLQKQGAGELDLDTMRELDPMIEDPERVKERIEVENLEKAWFTGIEQLFAQNPADSAILLAKVIKARQEGQSVIDAFLDVHAEMQQQQAQQAAPPSPGTSPTAAPGGPSPEQMPGAAATTAAPAAQPQSLEDLLNQLGNPTQPPKGTPYINPAPAPAGV